MLREFFFVIRTERHSPVKPAAAWLPGLAVGGWGESCAAVEDPALAHPVRHNSRPTWAAKRNRVTFLISAQGSKILRRKLGGRLG